MEAKTIWGLHHSGGQSLVEEGVIAIGWVDAGDITDLADEREEFKEHLRVRYSEKSENWIANAAGQLLRFRHVMRPGDLVVYPRKIDHTVNVGRISGEYRYSPEVNERYPHRRPVEWLSTELPRGLFSQGCLYELGSAMSVFKVKTHRLEILEKAGLGGEAGGLDAPPGESESTPEDEPTAERIGELTRDYILQTFETDLKGHPFAQFCGWVLEALGYTAQVSRPGADQGIDIVATEDPLGVRRPLLKVQCKSGSGAIGSADVQALNGTLAENELGLFVAIGGFTSQARQVASGMPRMRLLGPDDFLDLVLEHYADLPDEAKAALRLRRVWVPDRPAADETL